MTDFNRYHDPRLLVDDEQTVLRPIWSDEDDDAQDDGPVVAASVTIILAALFVIIVLGLVGCANPTAPSASEGCAKGTATGFAVELHVAKASCADDPIQHKAVR